MIEILTFIISLGLVGAREEKRGGSKALLGIDRVVWKPCLRENLGFKVGSLYVLVGIAWLGITWAGAFWLTGGMRTAGMMWICADCGLLNDPSTLLCGCGRRYDQS